MTTLMPRRRGKLKREEQSLPPNIQRAFIARANGAYWIESAAIGETTTKNLREWRKHPDADAYIQEAINLNLSESHQTFSNAAPALAQELVDITLDKKLGLTQKSLQLILPSKSFNKELLIVRTEMKWQISEKLLMPSKEVKHQKLLMLNQMDDEYPRGAKKFFKPSLKGEKAKKILRDWIKYLKVNKY